VELVPLGSISLQIFSLNQVIHSLLNQFNLRGEMALHRLNRCRLDFLVRHRLVCLHDAHDSRIKVHLPVAFNCCICLLRFFELQQNINAEGVQVGGTNTYRNLRLNRVNVDLGPGVHKIGIEMEYIVIIDISAWRNLLQHLLLATGETL